jgi:6-phosphogluconolactonase (cycloisomerase 2 family)
MAAPAKRVFAYVGTYSNRGKGIHLLSVDLKTGALTPLRDFAGVANPSSLVISPDGRFLYAVNEVAEFEGQKTGAVSAFAIDRATGDLRALNAVSSGGAEPAHIGIDPQGRHVFAANYGGGSVAVLPVKPDGTLGAPTDIQKIAGPLGPTKAKDAPPGSFADSGHDAPHAHMAALDPTGKFLLVSDLGTDRIYVYRFDRTAGKLTPNDPAFVQAAPGAGPRHFAFRSNGRMAYSLNEEASTIDVMDYDGARGAFAIRQTLSSLPKGFAGTNYPSEIGIAPGGRYVYAANRLHDSIGIFAIGLDGRLKPAGDEWTRGSYPRHFATDPSGKFLYVLHSRSDNVTIFRIEGGGARLAFTGLYAGIGNPSQIAFLLV